jgi:hypothetical protein
MPIVDMTPEEILLATAEQIAQGLSGTDRTSKLLGETSGEANTRITQGYKDLVAKPILTQELIDANAQVKFVRQGAGGIGEYVIVTPIGAVNSLAMKATEFGVGIIPANSKYITGTTLGTFSNGDGTVTNIGEVPFTTITQSGTVSSRSFQGQDAYYENKVGNTGKTQSQLDLAEASVQALKFNQDIATLLGGTVDPKTGKVTGVAGKTVTSVTPNADGTTTILSSDGTSKVVNSPASAPAPTTPLAPTTPPAPTSGGGGGGGGSSTTKGLVVNTQNQFGPESKGYAERKSAYDLLFEEFNQYGLSSLVTPLKDLIISGVSPSEFTLRLRDTDAYKKRFAANAQRIAKGLGVLSEAAYIGLEDQYQNVMRNYGLPESYYTRGDMGRQEGFEKFLSNDVSAAELEDRVMTAQQRVINSNPEVLASLKQFYPNITNGDILAYTLDPTKAITDIKRKVTAAEIGGAATQAGLGIGGTRAEELGAAGITKQQAQQGFQTVAEVAPRGGQLAAIYGESAYTQTTAEQEIFGLAGSVDAAKQRKKLVGLEKAAFSGQTGAAQGALGRERAGAI